MLKLLLTLLGSFSAAKRDMGDMGLKVYPHPVTFSLLRSKVIAGSDWVTETYKSSAFPLKPGQVVFTDYNHTKIKMFSVPAGSKVAIQALRAEVVDDANISVPLDEVYNHHWLFFDLTQPNAGFCGGYLSYLFGVGAESRLTPTTFPSPYVIATSQQLWGANIHLMRTVGLDPQYGTKGCIECLYAPNKGCTPSQTGSFYCCLDGSFCPVTQPGAAKNYYLQYEVTWRLFDSTDDLPLIIFVLDASNCEIEYNIYGSNTTNTSVTDLTWASPAQPFRFVMAMGHMHEGALNITLLWQGAGTSTWTTLCSSYPTYGTVPGQVGNEGGYLTKMSTCQDLSQKTGKGDSFRVVSYYNVGPTDDRTWNAGGMHGGVMSLFYVAGYPLTSNTLAETTV